MLDFAMVEIMNVVILLNDCCVTVSFHLFVHVCVVSFFISSHLRNLPPLLCHCKNEAFPQTINRRTIVPNDIAMLCHPDKMLYIGTRRRLVGKGCGFINDRPLATSSSSSSAAASVTLQFLHDESVAIVTLHNSQRRNALTASMMEQLDMHVQSLSRWSTSSSSNNDARAVILTGSGGTFCSGLDLHDNNDTGTTTTTKTKTAASSSSEDTNNTDCSNNSSSRTATSRLLRDGETMLHHMTRVTNQLLSLPVLSISAVDGYAVGGGAELTTCTDLVVLSRNAKIQFVHAKRGASPGWGGLRRLIKKVGRERALRMLLLGECVLGEEETPSYYADVVANEGETALRATMRAIINPLLDLPCSRSIRAIKRAVSCADGDGEVMDNIDGTLKFDTNMAMMGERDAFLSVWGGKANVEQILKARDRMRTQGKSGKLQEGGSIR